jgi:hypothetical protein
MKSRLNPTPPPPINYPTAMESRHNVVMFYEACKGQIVGIKVESPSVKIGQYYDNWDMKTFTPFKGDIILSIE